MGGPGILNAGSVRLLDFQLDSPFDSATEKGFNNLSYAKKAYCNASENILNIAKLKHWLIQIS